jgi:sterol desaturase/sphingolipid hydroxylase (fatty acid hydroxylase superfamily)
MDFHSYHHLKFTGNFGGQFKFWDYYFCKTVHPKYLKWENNEGEEKRD